MAGTAYKFCDINCCTNRKRLPVSSVPSHRNSGGVVVLDSDSLCIVRWPCARFCTYLPQHRWFCPRLHLRRHASRTFSTPLSGRCSAEVHHSGPSHCFSFRLTRLSRLLCPSIAPEWIAPTTQPTITRTNHFGEASLSSHLHHTKPSTSSRPRSNQILSYWVFVLTSVI